MTDRTSPLLDRSGSFEQALANAQRLLDQDPPAALRQAETLVRLKQDARVFRLAAAAARKMGLKADAEGAELGAIQASLELPELKEAAACIADGRYSDGYQIAENCLQKNPDDLLAMTIAAEASTLLWELDRAERLLKSVLERAPTFLRASMLLATCYAQQAWQRKAIEVLDDVVARKPDNVPALTNLAQMRLDVGDIDQAIQFHERLVALDETRPDRWVNLAHSYRIQGRGEDSIRAFRRGLAIDPSKGSAWWGLTNYYPNELGVSDEQAIRAALGKHDGSADAAALRLALAQVEDRRGDHAAAFEDFAAGKKARLEQLPYDPEPTSVAVDGVIEAFTPEFYKARRQSGWPDSSPIFIIGMPRSGTTLVERVLGRHSKVEGTGELKIIRNLAENIRHHLDNPEHYAAMLEMVSNEQLAWFGERYVEASRDYRRTGKPHFIDKNNFNWTQVGLILLALPDAKIIDVRRNALDCCWANFKMLFTDWYPATNDLRHVGRFYRDYVRLFDAMKRAAPERILSVRYEDVVDDLEGQTRRMLDFLDLDFEPQCLDFHLTEGAVATASSEQVRQPLNRKGIGSAEPYRQWLEPLIEELGPLAEQPA
jgi:tetratricopeptide (TPR) repeat protein